MMNQDEDKTKFTFLSFANNEDDKKHLAKLREAASIIEAKQRFRSELIDYKETDNTVSNSEDISLFDRLEEVRKLKQEQFEESMKLSNQIAKLDDDDILYLEELERKKQEDIAKKELELEKKKRQFVARSADEEERKHKIALTTSHIDYEKQKSFIRNKLSSLIGMKRKKPVPKESKEIEKETGAPKDIGTSESMKSTTSQTKRDSRAVEEMPIQSIDGGKRKHGEESSDDEGGIKKRKEDEYNIQTRPLEMQVMRCIGILPSLPIVTKMDSDDSDASDIEELDFFSMLHVEVEKNDD